MYLKVGEEITRNEAFRRIETCSWNHFYNILGYLPTLDTPFNSDFFFKATWYSKIKVIVKQQPLNFFYQFSLQNK